MALPAQGPAAGRKGALNRGELTRPSLKTSRQLNEPGLGKLFGLPLSNPIGLAAGFDKNAEAIDGQHSASSTTDRRDAFSLSVSRTEEPIRR